MKTSSPVLTMYSLPRCCEQEMFTAKLLIKIYFSPFPLVFHVLFSLFDPRQSALLKIWYGQSTYPPLKRERIFFFPAWREKQKSTRRANPIKFMDHDEQNEAEETKKKIFLQFVDLRNSFFTLFTMIMRTCDLLLRESN